MEQEMLQPQKQSFGQTRPIIPNGTHPIETRKYVLGTPEIDRLGQAVSEWIDNRTPGGIIWGRPRLGKTWAIRYLMNAMPIEFGLKMPVFLVLCNQYRYPNEGVFYEDLLKGVKHGIPYSGRPSVKRDRLIKYLLEQVEKSAQNRIIMFFDEAQRFGEIQYGWLMDVYNGLEREGASLTAILVGQRELLQQRSTFIETEKYQIVGRFMTREYQFSGVIGVEDLKSCLNCYDEESIFPIGSDWSYTRYFFPNSFDTGFRLADCADNVHEAFVDLRGEAGLKTTTFEIPMQYVTLMIEYCLRRFGVNGSDVGWLNKNHWKEAMYKSGYIESEMIQGVFSE